jgi:hypothetical protein
MARGRLIFPFLVELYQLDTAATEADPDGAGPLASGYDDAFREPIQILESPDDQTGKSARVESAPILFLAQIEPIQFEKLNMMQGGDSPSSLFSIVLHYADLERRGLVDATGHAMIRKGDRLARILNCDTGALIEEIQDPPGMYVHLLQSRSFGLGTDRNILMIEFVSREQSSRG